MTRSEIVALLRQPLLAAALPEPVAWPNVPSPGGVRVEWALTDPDRTDRTVALDAPTERGRVALTVVGLADEGQDPADARADALAALYPAGLRLTAPGLLIVIDRPPVVRPGYRDGPEWRVPVVIPYAAYPA